MEVHCESCPAKYAVPDEKVRGKKVRIKCKHCGSAIIVDGTSLGVAAAAPAQSRAATPQPKPAAAAKPATTAVATKPAAAAAADAKPAAAAPKPAVAPQPAAPPKPATATPATKPEAPAPAIRPGWREPASTATPSAAASPGASAWREPAAVPARGIKSTMLGIPAPAGAPAPVPAAPAAAPARAAKATLLGGLEVPSAAARAAVAPGTTEPARSPPRSVKRTMLGIPAPAGELPLRPEAPRASATEPAPAPEEPHGVAELEGGEEPEWTVAVTDEQHEEMTTKQVIAAYADGTIDDETFIWAEGMDDWKTPFEIPLLAAELETRGYGPGSAGLSEDATVVTEAPSDSKSLAGVWREPGSWRPPELGDAEGEGDISFDDVTVSMDSSKAQELLRAAGAEDARSSGSLGDTLMDDAAHDDVTLAVDSRPFFAESAPLAERRGSSPQTLEQQAPLDWDDEQTMAMDAPPASADGRLTGARNEDSVLFSLDALAESQSQRPPAPAESEPEADFLRAAPPPPLAPSPIGAIRPAPPMPPPPPMMAPPPPTAVAPAAMARPMAPAMAPPPAMAAPAGVPGLPAAHPGSAIAAIASAPYPPQSVTPKRKSRAWLWLLLLLVLAGAAVAASYYFRQPARVWQMLDGVLHPPAAR